MTQEDWRVTSTVGGKLTRVRPVFSPDQQHILVLTSLELRVYLLSSKQCIRSIPVDSTEMVRDLYPTDKHLVWVARRDGKCDVIDWMEREHVQTVDLDASLVRILNVTKSKVMAVVEGKNKHGYSIVERNIEKGSLRQYCHSKSAKLFAVSNNRQYYAFFSTSHKQGDHLVIGKVGGESKSFDRKFPLSSLAVSDDGTVAAGSSTGVIDLYYEPLTSNTVRALKWHVDEVLSLCFSLDNNYLLSGGKEKVLVFWQLETDNTQFLPRLDGAVKDIIVDSTSELYALTLGDDQILVLSAVDLVSRLQVSGIKAQFTKVPNDPERERRRRKKLGENAEERVGDYTTMFAIHPRSKSLYLPTNISSQLQIYDIQKDDQVQVMSVASTVQTGKVRAEQSIEDAKVMHISFTRDGLWMATVDENKTPPVDHLMSKDDKNVELKFWKQDKNGNWELASRVSSPHGYNKSVLDVIPHVNGHGFITAAEDGGVRLWRPAGSSNSNGTIAWSVRRILPPSGTTSSAVALSLSPDGSVLLLGFETSIYVVDASRFEIVRPLPNILGGRVRSLHFASSSTLVALSKTRVVVWDLVNGVAQWSIATQSPQGGRRLLAVDRINSRFAIGINHFDKDYKTVGKVFVFDVKSPLPIHIENHTNAIAAVKLIPGTTKFAFMDVFGRVSTLSSGPSERKKQRKLDVMQEMAYLYQIKQSQQPQKQEQEHVLLPDGQSQVLNINSFDTVFDGQSEYSVETLSSLFDKVMGVVSK